MSPHDAPGDRRVPPPPADRERDRERDRDRRDDRYNDRDRERDRGAAPLVRERLPERDRLGNSDREREYPNRPDDRRRRFADEPDRGRIDLQRNSTSSTGPTPPLDANAAPSSENGQARNSRPPLTTADLPSSNEAVMTALGNIAKAEDLAQREALLHLPANDEVGVRETVKRGSRGWCEMIMDIFFFFSPRNLRRCDAKFCSALRILEPICTK